jgi:hypothetical protein
MSGVTEQQILSANAITGFHGISSSYPVIPKTVEQETFSKKLNFIFILGMPF